MYRKQLAVWAVTEQGARIAAGIAREHSGAQLYLKSGIENRPREAIVFQRLTDAVWDYFHSYRTHVFVMATGIVVRAIAPLISSKYRDPAVVTIDESGSFVISLLSGHVGGANRMTAIMAAHLGATPVITTATDLARVPAIDVLALEKGLTPENPEAAKDISMALLDGEKVKRFDPRKILEPELADWTQAVQEPEFSPDPGIIIHHGLVNIPDRVLVLRPKSLVIGMGCNSKTDFRELEEALQAVLKEHGLSPKCIDFLATIQEKTSETGLLELAHCLGRPLMGFTRDILGQVKNVPSPSETVQKHMGVESVCEAAAIMGAGQGKLLVPKQKSGNVTVAVAETRCI